MTTPVKQNKNIGIITIPGGMIAQYSAPNEVKFYPSLPNSIKPGFLGLIRIFCFRLVGADHSGDHQEPG
jgi:hypothetical protein